MNWLKTQIEKVSFLKTLSFQKRLLLLLLLSVGIIFLAGQWLQYSLTEQQMREKEQEQARANLASMKIYLDMKMKNIIERLYYIRLNPDFEKALKQVLLEPEKGNDSSVLSGISSTFALYKITEPLIYSLYFYTPVGSYTDNTVFVEKNFSFENSPFYEYMEEKDSIVFGEPVRDEIFITHKDVIPVLYKFRVEGYEKEVGLLANLDRNALYEYMDNILLFENVSVLLVSQSGQEIMRNVTPENRDLFEDKQVLQDLIAFSMEDEQDFFEYHTGGKEYWINTCKLANMPWSVVYLRSRESVLNQLTMLTGEYIGLSAILLTMIFLTVTWLIRHFTRPIKELSDVMETAGEKKYEIDFHYSRQDEIGRLAQSYNHMIGYTRELFEQLNQSIEQLKEEKEKVQIGQLLKRRAELKALQAQINPHFLYNTLDSIRWKAEEIDAEEISQMTQALARVFRIGLSRGQELIPVREEIRHVDSYLEIQHLRYGNLLRHEIEMDESLADFYTVKLILQPLVENSIYHGIKEKGKPGIIRIRVKREESRIVFTVEDNGAGIEAKRLETLNYDLSRNLVVSKEGYGIFNVNERIRLYFGDAYGLKLESRYKEGTKALVTVPVTEEKDVEKYVPYSDSR